MDAAVTVLAENGLDGLSIRHVAAEAGISIGGVQHHFASKDELLVAASQHVTDLFKDLAIKQTQPILVKEGPKAAFLTFCQLLANSGPDTAHGERGTTPSVVWLWFAAQATKPGNVADAFTAAWRETEDYLHGVIVELFPYCDASEEAAYLLALLDGLAVARATEPARMPPIRARSIIQSHFRRLDAHQIADLQ